MTLVKFNPEKKNSSLMPGFNDMFESVLGDTFFSDRRIAGTPLVNISENSESFQIELAVPGLKKTDFSISVERNMLTISTERSEEHQPIEKAYNRREFSYSAFTRAFSLPEGADIDHISASYTDGILMLSVPKKEEARAVLKQIEIQ